MQRNRRQIEQPRGDHTSAPPNFRDVREVEIVLEMFRILEWRRLRIRCSLVLTDIRTMKHVQSFRVRGHQSVFDAVVNHLHEMSCPGWPTVKIAFARSARIAVTSRCW